MFEPAVVSVLKNTPVLSKPLRKRSDEDCRGWGVFVLCLVSSAVGVFLSFLVFGTAITGARVWGVGVAVSVIMLGLSYGAKYATPKARGNFTPLDFVQYLTQGFLWPSAWPGLAKLIGLEIVPPPAETGGIFSSFLHEMLPLVC